MFNNFFDVLNSRKQTYEENHMRCAYGQPQYKAMQDEVLKKMLTMSKEMRQFVFDKKTKNWKVQKSMVIFQVCVWDLGNLVI